MNHYEILEVSQNASQEVLKAAYKSLMQRYHPDKNPDNAEAAAHSILVVQAYEILSDSSKRIAYDIELKRQLESNIKVRNVPGYMSLARAEPERKPNVVLWLLLILIAFAIWFVWFPPGKKQSASPEAKAAIPLLGNYQPNIQQNEPVERVPALGLGARTISGFIPNINVDLDVQSEPTNASPDEARYVLTIQNLGVVVGSFDADKFIAFLEENKNYIKQNLLEKLARTKYEMLTKRDGELYLKQIILDSIAETTATNRFEEYPATSSESPAHYGVVDILLPSFTVKSLQTVQPQPGEGG